MRIIERAVLTDGTKIQLEDWREYNTSEHPDLYGLTIGAYPIAKNTGKYRWVNAGDRFRLCIPSNSYKGYTSEDVKKDYELLKSGSITIKDLADKFYYSKRDMWFLGMDVEYEGW